VINQTFAFRLPLLFRGGGRASSANVGVLLVEIGNTVLSLKDLLLVDADSASVDG
jgi:hypothetical protein